MKFKVGDMVLIHGFMDRNKPLNFIVGKGKIIVIDHVSNKYFVNLSLLGAHHSFWYHSDELGLCIEPLEIFKELLK